MLIRTDAYTDTCKNTCRHMQTHTDTYRHILTRAKTQDRAHIGTKGHIQRVCMYACVDATRY